MDYAMGMDHGLIYRFAVGVKVGILSNGAIQWEEPI
jgi:hypothetical protein